MYIHRFRSAMRQAQFTFCTRNHTRPSALNGSAPWPHPPSPSPPCRGHGSHHLKNGHEAFEATKALWLSVAGVMVIALGWNVIVLILKLY